MLARPLSPAFVSLSIFRLWIGEHEVVVGLTAGANVTTPAASLADAGPAAARRATTPVATASVLRLRMRDWWTDTSAPGFRCCHRVLAACATVQQRQVCPPLDRGPRTYRP